MSRFLLLLFSLLVCSSFAADMRGWKLRNGKTIEAEFVAFNREKISLKDIKGNIKKIPVSSFSREDLLYIELQNPPKLDIVFGKTTEARLYPAAYGNFDMPRQSLFTFSAKVKQVSNRPYSHPLTLEFFAFLEERNGDKERLCSYQVEQFSLEGPGSLFSVKSHAVPVTEYELNGEARGLKYEGYMIIVTDSRGEVIASKASKDDWFPIVDQIRNIPVSRTFDPDTGERCHPTRPKRFY